MTYTELILIAVSMFLAPIEAYFDTKRIKNNLFVDIKGYARNGVTYTIDFFSLEGETENEHAESWKNLDDLICNKTYVANDGKQYKLQLLFLSPTRQWHKS